MSTGAGSPTFSLTSHYARSHDVSKSSGRCRRAPGRPRCDRVGETAGRTRRPDDACSHLRPGPDDRARRVQTVIMERARAELLLEHELDSTCSMRCWSLPVITRRPRSPPARRAAKRRPAGGRLHTARTAGRVLMGDDTRAALNGAPCAVAIASRGYQCQPHQLETLGVGYDGSPESSLALGAAASWPPNTSRRSWRSTSCRSRMCEARSRSRRTGPRAQAS